MKKFLLVVFGLLLTTPALAAAGADFNYQKVTFVGTDAPVKIITAYDYKQQTFIKVTQSQRPNLYNASDGEVVSAYTCHNNSLIEVPLHVSGGYYVADGLYHSLYLYRRAAAGGVLRDVAQPRDLLNGIVRLDYVGARALELRYGRDDCMAMLRDFFSGLQNNAKVSLDIGTQGKDQPSDEIRAAVSETAARITRGSERSRAQPPTSAVTVQEQPQVYETQQLTIPFYVNRTNLGKIGRQILKDDVVPLAREADKIIIRPRADTQEAQANLQDSLGEDEEVVFTPVPKLLRYRASEILSWLILEGIDSAKITMAIDDQTATSEHFRDSSDALVEFEIPVSSPAPAAVRADAPVAAQANTGVFIGEQFKNEQITVVVDPKIVFARVPDVGEVSAVAASPITAAMSEQEKYAAIADLNVFRAARGQLLSDAVAKFLQKNGYQMIWQVEQGLDWRIDADTEIQGAHLINTMRKVLDAFPIQAVFDADGGRFVQIRIIREPKNPENPVGDE